MMKKDVEFIFDEEWEEQGKELSQILHEIKDPELHKNVFVLESFVRAVALAFFEREKKEVLGREIAKSKYYRDNLGIVVDNVQKIAKPGELHEDKEGYIQDIEFESAEQLKNIDFSESHETKKNLIVDRITKRVLASASIGDKYILNEPELDERDIKTLNKVKKKKLKNVEKGWKLIQKYGKKMGIKTGHDTSIKYYLVNDVFGLGKIEPFLHDSKIESFKCDGSDKEVVITIDGKDLVSNVKFVGEDLVNFIYGMTIKLGKKISKKIPNIKGEMRGFIFLLNAGENLDNPSFSVKRL